MTLVFSGRNSFISTSTLCSNCCPGSDRRAFGQRARPHHPGDDAGGVASEHDIAYVLGDAAGSVKGLSASPLAYVGGVLGSSLAGGGSAAAFVPQAYKVWKTKSTKDISLWMFLIFTTGVASWLVYGVLTNNLFISYH